MSTNKIMSEMRAHKRVMENFNRENSWAYHLMRRLVEAMRFPAAWEVKSTAYRVERDDIVVLSLQLRWSKDRQLTVNSIDGNENFSINGTISRTSNGETCIITLSWPLAGDLLHRSTVGEERVPMRTNPNFKRETR